MPSLNRRHALQLLASSVASGMASCSRPTDEIVPYVDMPERVVPGEPLKFATSLALAGYGRGVIGITYEGRPTKLEGNPLHPASRGGTDAFMEADILDLYDPARSKAPRGNFPAADWGSFAQAFEAARAQAGGDDRFALRLLTGRMTSPTFFAQWQALTKRFPAAQWHRYEPIDDDNETQGLKAAFGKPLLARPRLADCDIVLCLGADPLGHGPEQPALARQFAQRRIPELKNGMLRLYVCESAWTLTGASADHRLALAPAAIRDFALAVAVRLGAQGPATPVGLEKEAALVAEDLGAHRGRALVIAGPGEHVELHALAAWMNARLAAPVDYIAPVDPVTDSHAASLGALEHDLDSGTVHALIVIGANPAYDRGVDFAHRMGRARFTAHMGLYADETAQACQWHVPMSHLLESWSDIRAPDGTASIVQPLITPLYDSRTPRALLALLADSHAAHDYDLVRSNWNRGSGDFEAWWRGALEKGVIDGTASRPATVGTPALPQIKSVRPAPLVLIARPDPSVWDGRYANNAWLQECPKPFTKEVWGNSIEIAPEDASAYELEEDGFARLSCGAAAVEAPVRIRRGQAKGVVAVRFGYGRTHAGPIGEGIGFDAWPLWARRTDKVMLASAASGTHAHSTFGDAVIDETDRKLFPRLTLSELARLAHPLDERQAAAAPTLLPKRAPDDGYSWAMAIDNTLCIGCNACVVACMAENNVPVVGPDEIDRHRDMHWLRIDSYMQDQPEGARIGFEPVPCMHCEDAPCEPVCPVEASVHDSEGLNVQVYNRCIGTRFCESNCPYKVRRFNWFEYTGYQAYADMGAPIVSAQRNPDVSVRARGVMEKCTYCVQRISRVRRQAEREKRAIRDGEVVTACQSACPTQAIWFGNLDDRKSKVVTQKSRKRHFTLLAELGTRPRTTYLAHVTNPNPAWEKPA